MAWFRKSLSALVISLLTTTQAMAFNYTIEISEAELQEKVAAFMPYEYKKFFVSLRLEYADVTLEKDTDEIAVFAKIEAKVPGGLKGSGSAKVRGSLSYEAERGEFYFKQAKIDQIQIKYVPQTLLDQVKQVAQMAFKKALATYPVYRFSEKSRQHKMAKSVLKDVRVDGKMLYLTLSPF